MESFPCPRRRVLREEGLDLLSYTQLVSAARRDGAPGSSILCCLDRRCDVGYTISRVGAHREHVEASE